MTRLLNTLSAILVFLSVVGILVGDTPPQQLLRHAAQVVLILLCTIGVVWMFVTTAKDWLSWWKEIKS